MSAGSLSWNCQRITNQNMNNEFSYNFPLHHQYLSRNVRNRSLWYVRPTRTQISLQIRAVCSESPSSAWKNFAFIAIQFHPVKIQISLRRLIWIFAGHTYSKLRFLMLRFISERNHVCHRHIFVVKWHFEFMISDIRKDIEGIEYSLSL